MYMESEILAIKELIERLRTTDTALRVFGADSHRYQIGNTLSEKEILDLLGKPTVIYTGFQNYGKSVPLDNIDFTFYYQLKSGELFIYFQNKICVKSKFKPTGIEY